MTRCLPLAALTLFATGCGSASWAELTTSTVPGLDEVAVVYHGGEHILLFDRKIDCLDVFWVQPSYINGQSPYASVDFVALQFSYDADAPTEAARFAVRVRHCTRDGELPAEDAPPPPVPFQPWFAWYDPARHGNRTVAFGHWAQRGLVQGPHLRGLDTGCVWGGRLTAWVVEEDRLVSVPARRAYQRPG